MVHVLHVAEARLGHSVVRSVIVIVLAGGGEADSMALQDVVATWENAIGDAGPITTSAITNNDTIRCNAGDLVILCQSGPPCKPLKFEVL
jgi:hypothetical protein